MRQDPTADHLDLWRGIDDAVWREALRALPSPRAGFAPPRPEGRRVEERAKPPVAAKIPEPV
jgi:hypothetical protein